MKFKVSYVYELEAPTKAEARVLMAKARQSGQDEELFSYVSVRCQDEPSLVKQVIGQLVG